MVREGDFVAVFNNIHRVMKAEKVLKGRHLNILLIPAPRSLVTDCGLAIRYGEADCETIPAALAEADLLPEEIYRYRNGSFVRVPEVM